jgi:hypothetical protein
MTLLYKLSKTLKNIEALNVQILTFARGQGPSKTAEVNAWKCA